MFGHACKCLKPAASIFTRFREQGFSRIGEKVQPNEALKDFSGILAMEKMSPPPPRKPKQPKSSSQLKHRILRDDQDLSF